MNERKITLSLVFEVSNLPLSHALPSDVRRSISAMTASRVMVNGMNREGDSCCSTIHGVTVSPRIGLNQAQARTSGRNWTVFIVNGMVRSCNNLLDKNY